MQGIRVPQEPMWRRRRISPEEIKRISEAIIFVPPGSVLTYAQEKTLAIFQLAIETGLRKSEILALRRCEVILDKGYLKVTGIERCARKSRAAIRDVPLTRAAREILHQALHRYWHHEFVFNMHENRFSHLFIEAVRRAGIENLRFHDTRHEAISRLAKIYQVLDLARIVGHRGVEELLVYYEPTIEELVDAMG